MLIVQTGRAKRWNKGRWLMVLFLIPFGWLTMHWYVEPPRREPRS